MLKNRVIEIEKQIRQGAYVSSGRRKTVEEALIEADIYTQVTGLHKNAKDLLDGVTNRRTRQCGDS